MINLKNYYMICLSIRNIEQVDVIKAAKPEMVELRFDLISESPEVVLPMLGTDAKVIATCRPGKYDDQQRIILLKSCIDLGVDIIDMEIESPDDYRKKLISYAKERNREVIISWHDFEKTPARQELELILEDCYNKGADIAKIATFVNKTSDNSNLLSLYSIEGRKVVLGMGERGKITRLAAIPMGAEFTFAATDSENETAPGQITLEEFAALNKIIKS